MARNIRALVKCHFRLPTSLTTADSLIVGLALVRKNPYINQAEYSDIDWETLKASSDIVYKRIHKRQGEVIAHAEVKMLVDVRKCQDAIRYEDGWVLNLDQFNNLDTRAQAEVHASMQRMVPAQRGCFVVPFVVPESTQIINATNRTWCIDYSMRVSVETHYRKPRSTLFSVKQLSSIYPGHKPNPSELPQNYDDSAEQAFDALNGPLRREVVLQDIKTEINNSEMKEDAEDDAENAALQTQIDNLNTGLSAVSTQSAQNTGLIGQVNVLLDEHSALDGKQAH
jgi:hypothetical protein